VTTNNKIQVIYRLEDQVTIFWPVRPNDGKDISVMDNVQSYNLYWDSSSGGAFNKLVGNVENKPHANRSFLNKVVMIFNPSRITGWDNSIVNYVRLNPVVGGVEQGLEDIIEIHPYSIGGMRFNKTEQKAIAVGYDRDDDRLVPIAVDKDGKVKTI